MGLKLHLFINEGTNDLRMTGGFADGPSGWILGPEYKNSSQ